MSSSPKESTGCALCSRSWQKNGATWCWSDPEAKQPMPNNCPSHRERQTIDTSFSLYRGDSEDARLAKAAARVEGMCYLKDPSSGTLHARWTRVEDTVALAALMGWKRIGIASCIGLLEETRRLEEILLAQELEPVSICCKAGSLDKVELGVTEQDKVRPGTFEPACNPVAQARILNERRTDMNLIVGLCVGHDMLFSKHSDAPVSTLVAKDRVTGHNPAAVLYGQNFYYKRLQKSPVMPDREH